MRQHIWRTLEAVKNQGQSVWVVDRDLDALARVCDNFAVMEKGRVVRAGAASELAGDRAALEVFLGA